MIYVQTFKLSIINRKGYMYSTHIGDAKIIAYYHKGIMVYIKTIDFGKLYSAYHMVVAHFYVVIYEIIRQ